ncbi:MAG: hypothetical protein SFZ02_03970 [bacterium]|nr:hypothetical protein [bacterium]
MKFRYAFDFHSPYPIEDCVNMLLGYIPTKEYKTRWGLGMGVKLDDKTLIKLFKQDDMTYQVEITPRPRNSVIQRHIQAIGTLHAQDSGTHITGSAINHIQYSLLPIIAMMVGLAFGAIVLNLWFIIPFSLVVLGLVWLDIIQTTYLVSTYPQRLLERAGERKYKKDEDEAV